MRSSTHREIRNFIFLGRGVERLWFFTTAYVILISAILANVILNQAFYFYYNKSLELTSGGVTHFILSSQGALFITVLALIVGCHYVLVPALTKPLFYMAKTGFILAGNLFFFSVHFIFTRIFRLKAEREYYVIGDTILMNYLLYLIRVCHYKHGHTVQNRFFHHYKWYVVNTLHPCRQTVYNVSLTTAMLISTWLVIHLYGFFELAPGIYFIIAVMAAGYIASTIIVSWIVNEPDYFLGIVTNSISPEDSLNLQPNSVKS